MCRLGSVLSELSRLSLVQAHQLGSFFFAIFVRHMAIHNLSTSGVGNSRGHLYRQSPLLRINIMLSPRIVASKCQYHAWCFLMVGIDIVFFVAKIANSIQCVLIVGIDIVFSVTKIANFHILYHPTFPYNVQFLCHPKCHYHAWLVLTLCFS